MKLSSLIASAFALCVMAATSAAQTSRATTTFQVTANIAPSCSSLTASGINLANYDPSSALVSTGTVSYTCNFNPASITLTSRNTSPGPGFTYLLNGAMNSSLPYGLYRDAAATGDQVTVDNNGLTPAGSSANYTLYAKIPAGQANRPADTYTDTITVNINY